MQNFLKKNCKVQSNIPHNSSNENKFPRKVILPNLLVLVKITFTDDSNKAVLVNKSNMERSITELNSIKMPHFPF